jgi:glycosyltransferase involved in cell wall biosynthesis
MRFSICIPNYNYADFIGPTIRSALNQEGELEVLVSDNASTDGSVDVVRALNDDRIRVRVNRTNVGFAGNLDRAVGMASGDWVILLSSDDLIAPGALACYRAVIGALGQDAARTIVAAGISVIDQYGRSTAEGTPPQWGWKGATRRADLEVAAAAPVLEMPANELLRRSLAEMRNPFYFASVAYPRSLWEEIEGYRGGRFFNPDKDFHWRLLGAADRAVFVDRLLFSWRVHGRNQSDQQRASGVLKRLVDEYAYTFDLDDKLLGRAGVTRKALAGAFIEHDVVRRGLEAMAIGDRILARRSLRFGQATYPRELARNRNAWILRGLLALGPVGSRIAAVTRHQMLARRSSQIRSIDAG